MRTRGWLSVLLLAAPLQLFACANPVVDDSGDAGATGGDTSGSGGASTGGADGGPTTGGSPTSGGAPSGGAATGGSATGGAATGGSSACGDGVTTAVDYQAQLKIDNNTDQTAYVSGEVHVTNIGAAVDASTIKVRYYFTSEVIDKKITVRWANSGGLSGATAVITAMAAGETTSTADYYIEFSPQGSSFTGEGVISYQMEPNNPASDKFTQSNDYSWDAAATTLMVTDKVVILENDVVVWGVPPC